MEDSKHEICAYGLKITLLNNFLAEISKVSKHLLDLNLMKRFLVVKTLQKLYIKIYSVLKERDDRFKKHNLIPEEEIMFHNSGTCHFCDKDFA